MLHFTFIQMDIFGLFSPWLRFRGQMSAGVRTQPPQLPLCAGLMEVPLLPHKYIFNLLYKDINLDFRSLWPFNPSYRSSLRSILTLN